MEFSLGATATRNVAGRLWETLARAGEIWVPEIVTPAAAAMLMFALRLHRNTEEIAIYIDTNSGGENSFEPCKELWARRERGQRTLGFVDDEAVSIGLSYIVVCTHRVATPDSEFTVHGGQRRDDQILADGTYLQDHYVADWLKRFTKRTYEEWLAMFPSGETVTFGVEEALEWGVIDEIRRSV